MATLKVSYYEAVNWFLKFFQCNNTTRVFVTKL